MKNNPHFESAETWEQAGKRLGFEPRVPSHTEGLELGSLSIYLRDHKMRVVPPEDRTLEAHYGDFVLSQSQPGIDEARRQALEVSYGQALGECRVHGHAGRVYELGPVPDPGDIDPRPPAVVVWHEGAMFYLVASDRLSSDLLLRIASSLYVAGDSIDEGAR